MDQLNWGYIQLGVVAIAFAGLQLWWIGCVFRKRERSSPHTNKVFRRSLEAIWENESCNLRIIRTNDGCQLSAGWVAVVLNLVIGLGTTYIYQRRSRAY